jgi:hypothetical protein
VSRENLILRLIKRKTAIYHPRLSVRKLKPMPRKALKIAIANQVRIQEKKRNVSVSQNYPR